MNHIYHPDELNRISAARESFSGRLMSDTQFEDAIAITGIMEREINRTGKFKEKLSDYAVAMARTEKSNVMQAENTIRDLFKARTGEAMNAMRERLVNNEQALTDHQIQDSYKYARETGAMIETGNKMSFHRAYARQAAQYAKELGITDAKAKSLMKETFKTQMGKELYDWGKELEQKYYRPQIESEKQNREAAREQSRTLQRTR